MLVSFMFEVIVLKICFLAKEQTMQAYYLLWKQKLSEPISSNNLQAKKKLSFENA